MIAIYYIILIYILICFDNGINGQIDSIVNTGSFYNITMIDIFGDLKSMNDYINSKAILIVNIASNCGHAYTNFKQLTDLYDRLHPLGLEILGFPCNQFGNQEPGDNEEILENASSYGITFPLFSKVSVFGSDCHSLYKFLKAYTGNYEIAWNFTKFLVVNGKVIRRYSPETPPLMIEPDILIFLNENSEL